MSIEFKNLSKSYPTRQGRHYVFRDANFTIPSHKSVALFGVNGAGKSTLLRMLGGNEPADSGRVHLTGSVSWPVGLAGGFHVALSARENCQFVLRIHGVRDEHLAATLDWVKRYSEIGKFFELPMSALSSGMRSRVAFALSMSMPFDYWLIDEITAVGDASFRDKSKQTLLAKKAAGSSFIMATHNIQEALSLADSGIVVHGQQLQYFEDVTKAADAYRLIAYPDSQYVKSLVAQNAQPTPDGKSESLV